MHFEGVARKMTTEYSSVINYFIEFENSAGLLYNDLNKELIWRSSSELPTKQRGFDILGIPTGNRKFIQ